MKQKNKMIGITGENSIAFEMVVSAVCRPASMIISYLYIPIALKYLGIEKYGIWSTILAILSWLGYFDIGIGNGLRNRLTEALVNKNGEERKLISSAYAFTAAIMAAAAATFSFIATFLDWNRILGTNNYDENLAAIIIFSVIFVAVNFVLSTCRNVLYALQKASDVSIIELIIQVINLIGVIIISKITSGSLYAMALIYGISSVLVNFAANLVVFSKEKALSPKTRYVDLTVGKNITNLGLQFFVVQICALILFTTDSLIISYLYGAVNVTPYNTVNKLFNVIIGVYTALISPVWNAVTKAKAENKFGDLQKLIKKLLLIIIPFVIGTALLVVAFRPLARIWLGQELDYSQLLIVFGGIYCFLTIWCNTFASISNGLELMKQSIIIAVLQAVINIPLSLVFAQLLGMESAGVLAGTVASMIISAIAHPIIIYKYIHSSCRSS